MVHTLFTPPEHINWLEYNQPPHLCISIYIRRPAAPSVSPPQELHHLSVRPQTSPFARLLAIHFGREIIAGVANEWVEGASNSGFKILTTAFHRISIGLEARGSAETKISCDPNRDLDTGEETRIFSATGAGAIRLPPLDDLGSAETPASLNRLTARGSQPTSSNQPPRRPRLPYWGPENNLRFWIGTGPA